MLMAKYFNTLLLLVLLFSCHQPSEKANDVQLQVDSIEYKINELLIKYNCKNEYDFARLYEYAYFYKATCLGSECLNEYGGDSIIPHKDLRLINTDLRLDIEDESPISIVNDTIIKFRIISFTNDKENCKCRYFSNQLYPTGITIVKETQKILWVHNGFGYSVAPEENDMNAVLNNPSMLNYVRSNKDKVNKWFYRELEKRGHLDN